LEFAAMFPKKKWKILAMDQSKVWTEKLLNGGERIPEPFPLGGEFGRPGIRGSEEKIATGLDEFGKNLLEKNPWVGEPIDQVGGQNKIKGAKIFRQAQGIAGLETDSPPVHPEGKSGEGGLRDLPFLKKAKRDFADLLHLFGRTDKGSRVVDPHNFRDASREFKA
jgi:hypothetical protein